MGKTHHTDKSAMVAQWSGKAPLFGGRGLDSRGGQNMVFKFNHVCMYNLWKILAPENVKIN